MSFYFSGINFFVNSSYIEIYSSHTIQFIDLICLVFFISSKAFIYLDLFLFIYILIYLLEDNCFTVLCWFLPYISMRNHLGA